MRDKLKGVLIAAGVHRGARDRRSRDRRSRRRRRRRRADRRGADHRQRARSRQPVALEEIGGGKVTGTEAGDEEGAYEVEVTSADGSQVDVHLDKSFKVLDAKADKADSEQSDGDGETNDDPAGHGDGEHADDGQ